MVKIDDFGVTIVPHRWLRVDSYVLHQREVCRKVFKRHVPVKPSVAKFATDVLVVNERQATKSTVAAVDYVLQRVCIQEGDDV